MYVQVAVHVFEGGAGVRGHPCSPIPLTEYAYLNIPDRFHLSNSLYTLPHRWQTPFPLHCSVCISIHSDFET